MSVFGSLNTAYTGLTGHQLMVDTTGHNLANMSNEFYSRQRVITHARTPLFDKYNFPVGQGLNIVTVERIFDEYTFQRYKKASAEKEYYDTTYSNLKEASSYYPDITKSGTFNDLQNYFNAWKDLATKSGDSAQKQNLVKYTQNLTKSVRDTRDRLYNLQKNLNEEMKTMVEEVNKLGSLIAQMNKQIREHESKELNEKANDLRDLRDQYEFELNALIGGTVSKEKIEGSAIASREIADWDEDYSIAVGRFVVVDGESFHPLVLDRSGNTDGFYSILYERQDYQTYNITSNIMEGKVGAILDLIRTEETMGIKGQVGKLQQYIDELDSFAEGFIEASNNIYAESSVLSIRSNEIKLKGSDALTTSGYNVKEGTLDVVMYDQKGNALATRKVEINVTTTMQDIVNQLNANVDDNNDSNAINDFDDYFSANYDELTGLFTIAPKNPSQQIYLSVQDSGNTNFAGAFGLNRLFSGNNAANIEIEYEYINDPTSIRPFREAVNGNFEIANKMQQLQYDKINFSSKDRKTNYSETIASYYQMIATNVAADAESANITAATKESVYTQIKAEFKSISEVSMDEEMTNLIKFQSGYSANAKIVTTLDEMIQTLLGIKT